MAVSYRRTEPSTVTRTACFTLSMLVIFAAGSLGVAQQTSSGDGVTSLPIQLEKLTEQQRAHIRKMHTMDRSPYLVETRPVLFQIQGVKDREDQTRGPVTFDRAVDVMIYCLGEAQRSRLVDYGWISEAETDRVVWKMDLEKTVQGGGGSHLRKQVELLSLPAGDYTLHYHSNESNSTSGWKDGAAERPFYYGITVFNLKAISKIRSELEEARLQLTQ